MPRAPVEYASDGTVWRAATRQCSAWVTADEAYGKDCRFRYYLYAAPAAATEEELIRFAGSRWAIGERFQTAKNETGLDQYQVLGYDAW